MARMDTDIAALTKSKAFAERVKHFVAQESLAAVNEEDITIVDEARVLAEFVQRNYRVRVQEFWDRQTLTAATGDVSFFTAQSTTATLHQRNSRAAGQFSRDELFFAKRVIAVLDPTATQADKRIILNDYVAQITIKSKPILERKVRALPSGGGLDGELNNGQPNIIAVFELPYYTRFASNQAYEFIVKRLTAIAGTPWLEFGMEGLYGHTK